MNKNTRRVAPRQAALIALLLALGLGAATAWAQGTTKAGKPKVPGVEVTVTAEMTGAGIVSAGIGRAHV